MVDFFFCFYNFFFFFFVLFVCLFEFSPLIFVVGMTVESERDKEKEKEKGREDDKEPEEEEEEGLEKGGEERERRRRKRKKPPPVPLDIFLKSSRCQRCGSAVELDLEEYYDLIENPDSAFKNSDTRIVFDANEQTKVMFASSTRSPPSSPPSSHHPPSSACSSSCSSSSCSSSSSSSASSSSLTKKHKERGQAQSPPPSQNRKRKGSNPEKSQKKKVSQNEVKIERLDQKETPVPPPSTGKSKRKLGKIPSQTTPLSLSRSPSSQSGSTHARMGVTSPPSRSDDIQIERISGYPAKDSTIPAQVPTTIGHPSVSGRFGGGTKVVGMIGMGGGASVVSGSGGGEERKEEGDGEEGPRSPPTPRQNSLGEDTEEEQKLRINSPPHSASHPSASRPPTTPPALASPTSTSTSASSCSLSAYAAYRPPNRGDPGREGKGEGVGGGGGGAGGAGGESGRRKHSIGLFSHLPPSPINCSPRGGGGKGAGGVSPQTIPHAPQSVDSPSPSPSPFPSPSRYHHLPTSSCIPPPLTASPPTQPKGPMGAIIGGTLAGVGGGASGVYGGEAGGGSDSTFFQLLPPASLSSKSPPSSPTSAPLSPTSSSVPHLFSPRSPPRIAASPPPPSSPSSPSFTNAPHSPPSLAYSSHSSHSSNPSHSSHSSHSFHSRPSAYFPSSHPTSPPFTNFPNHPPTSFPSPPSSPPFCPPNNQLPSHIVNLNVGGYHFSTTVDTLVRQSNSDFFQTLFSGKIPTTLDEEGRYFIDRNGKIFEPLLDFLRTNILDIPPGISRQHVLEQAHFFGIKIDGMESILSSQMSQHELVKMVNRLGSGRLQLPGYQLQNRSLAYFELPNSVFTEACLSGGNLQNATLTHSDFRMATLCGINASHANLYGAKFKGADLRGAILEGAYLQHADLREADLRFADLRGADLQYANLFGATLSNIKFKGAKFRGCEGLSSIQLMCGECGNSYKPELNQRQACPATLGSHFPAEIQPFECDQFPE